MTPSFARKWSTTLAALARISPSPPRTKQIMIEYHVWTASSISASESLAALRLFGAFGPNAKSTAGFQTSTQNSLGWIFHLQYTFTDYSDYTHSYKINQPPVSTNIVLKINQPTVLCHDRSQTCCHRTSKVSQSDSKAFAGEKKITSVILLRKKRVKMAKTAENQVVLIFGWLKTKRHLWPDFLSVWCMFYPKNQLVSCATIDRQPGWDIWFHPAANVWSALLRKVFSVVCHLTCHMPRGKGDTECIQST